MRDRGLAIKVALVALLFIVFIGAQLASHYYRISLETRRNLDEIPYSELLTLLSDGKVSEAKVYSDLAEVRLSDGAERNVRIGDLASLQSHLNQSGATYALVRAPSGADRPVWLVVVEALGAISPMLIVVTLLLFIIGRFYGGLSLKQTKVKGEAVATRFSDVAGIEDVVEDLAEAVSYLKNARTFAAIGARPPKGVMLVGPPGTGKTLVAKAVAGEAGVPFFSLSGSDFVEMFVGVGAKRVRELFTDARRSAPCIIFIDEIDAIGGKRSGGSGNAANREYDQTLNQLLVELDGFAPDSGIIVMAATNRVDMLDPALRRPGRFDRTVRVELPDVSARTSILEVHLKKVAASPDLDVATIAKGTPGFSGAELANLVNESALIAARSGAGSISNAHVDAAKDRILLGAERRSISVSEFNRKLTAYHEAGHAICCLSNPGSDAIHKLTIIPRGGALGMMVQLPEGDRVMVTRQRLHADLATLLGGRAAEEIVFGASHVTTGASSDLKTATSIAMRMVGDYGMSRIGLVTIPISASAQDSIVSPALLDEAASEVQRILNNAYDASMSILQANRAKLDLLAEALLERETLSGAEIRAVVGELNQAAQ